MRVRLHCGTDSEEVSIGQVKMVEYSFGMIVASHERQAGLKVVYFGLFITNDGFMQCDWFSRRGAYGREGLWGDLG